MMVAVVVVENGWFIASRRGRYGVEDMIGVAWEGGFDLLLENGNFEVVF